MTVMAYASIPIPLQRAIIAAGPSGGDTHYTVAAQNPVARQE